MDAIELLKHDHRMVEQLFRDYRAAASDVQRRGVVEVLVRELSKHAALAELMVYPLARQVFHDGSEEIGQHLDEHMAVKELLLELDRLRTGDERTDDLMERLRQEVERHMREEEEELLPKLRAAMDDTALGELGQALDRAKRTAPTRPHPHAPEEPPALALAAPVASVYDRLCDRLQGRPRT
ncbi:hemerythrin domain-containing protein [Streptomyces orinoci]|uniref:Hemerythrin domain-containing protein n=1 Tax=Streptomyces orinoci TaxID=67339 RepID=A0ABV3K6L9_STRON|nr:hemerythrin domain-containing protein [Streptomyces orinoci]